jgi:hypothetical protein
MNLISSILISKQLLDYCHSDSKLRNILFRALVKISKRSELYPTSLILRDIKLTSRYPLTSGTYGDIYTAEIRGRNVAVKLVRKYAKQEVEKLRKVRRECIIKEVPPESNTNLRHSRVRL